MTLDVSGTFNTHTHTHTHTHARMHARMDKRTLTYVIHCPWNTQIGQDFAFTSLESLLSAERVAIDPSFLCPVRNLVRLSSW